jgi:hypothetical protein
MTRSTSTQVLALSGLLGLLVVVIELAKLTV